MSASIFSTICLETKKKTLLIAKTEIRLTLRSFNKRKAHVLKVDTYFYVHKLFFKRTLELYWPVVIRIDSRSCLLGEWVTSVAGWADRGSQGGSEVPQRPRFLWHPELVSNTRISGSHGESVPSEPPSIWLKHPWVYTCRHSSRQATCMHLYCNTSHYRQDKESAWTPISR